MDLVDVNQSDAVRVDYMALSKLPSAPRNAKGHDHDSIGGSYGRFGAVSPPIINEKTGRLVAGHGRLAVLRRAKANGQKPPARVLEVGDEWYVPVIRGIAFANEQEAEAYLLADNQTTILGAWDETELLAILREHKETEAGLEGTGFTVNDLDDLLSSIASRVLLDEITEDQVPWDRAAELQRKWGTECGQFWTAGPHFLLCGDARAIPSGLFDNRRIRMVCGDPPYGVHLSSKNEQLGRLRRSRRKHRAIANDDLPPERVGELLLEVLKATLPHCERGAAAYICAPAGRLLPIFIEAFDKSGFRFRWQLTWVKQALVLSRGADYHQRHENILYGWLDNGPHYFIDDRTQDSVFEVDRSTDNELHPTPKPIALIARMVRNSSRPGEIVFDPFCGSGSTLVAAHQLERIGCGIEIDPVYLAVALERLEGLGLKPKLEQIPVITHTVCK